MKKFIRYDINNSAEVEYDIMIAFLSDWGIDAFEELEETLIASGVKEMVNQEEIDHYLSSEGITFEKSEVEDQNWNAVWESSFEPVIMDDFAAIRASFHEPVAGVAHEIIITPKMSFGTGHHATTWLMMQIMKDIDFKGKRVFDFGTGTGVLAILAEKLGARAVEAIDNDEWSIENAKENFGNNDEKAINVKLQETLPDRDTFEILLANINKHILLEQMPGISKCVSTGGIALLSGLLESDELDIRSAAGTFQLEFEKKLEKNGWIALFFRKGSAENGG
jgi:ribosomal protein L11 methyltransferase